MNEIRDPVHGFITLQDDELNIINTSLFQRLRKIRQLAMAYLVYPGANHNRFEQSLGVFFVAPKMAQKLFPNDDDKEKIKVIRMSALLHDIGHGPFSHVSERILKKYNYEKFGEDNSDIHEIITWDLIEQNKEISEL